MALDWLHILLIDPVMLEALDIRERIIDLEQNETLTQDEATEREQLKTRYLNDFTSSVPFQELRSFIDYKNSLTFGPIIHNNLNLDELLVWTPQTHHPSITDT
jgi:hypothetical protein